MTDRKQRRWGGEGNSGPDSKVKRKKQQRGQHIYTTKAESVQTGRKRITININPENNISTASSLTHGSPIDTNGPTGPRYRRSSASNLSARICGGLQRRDTSARSSHPHRKRAKLATLCRCSTRTNFVAEDFEEDWEDPHDSMIRHH